MQDSSVVAAAYRFLDRWAVPHPVERVFDAVGEPLAYPEWWPDVFLAAEGDGGPPEPGKRISVVARGFLPYRLRFTMECLEVERPVRILSRLTGDFEGTGEWRLREDGDVTLLRARLAPGGGEAARPRARRRRSARSSARITPGRCGAARSGYSSGSTASRART